MRRMSVFYTVYWVHPGFLSLWQIQQSFLRYVGVAEATQWLPSGHDEDQSCRAGQVGTMRAIWAPEPAPGPPVQQRYLQPLVHRVDGGDEDGLPDVVCPQRDLQFPQNLCGLLNPPAKLLQRERFGWRVSTGSKRVSRQLPGCFALPPPTFRVTRGSKYPRSFWM